MFIATDNSTFPVVVSLSAYPLAFPKALASETILPPQPMRLTTYSDIDRFREQLRSLLRSQLLFCAARRLPLSTGIIMRVLAGQFGNCPPRIRSLLGKPLNPRGLVPVDDGSDVDSLALALCSFAWRNSQSGFE